MEKSSHISTANPNPDPTKMWNEEFLEIKSLKVQRKQGETNTATQTGNQKAFG